MLKKRGEQRTDFFSNHKSWMAITTLIGTVVGAGMLGIPYVLAKAGFLWGIFLIVLLGVALLFVNLFAGEIVLRTKKQFQLTGYVGKYLGRWGRHIMTLAMGLNIYGALVAYLIGEGETLRAIFGFGSPLMYSLIFFVLTFIIIYKGMKATGRAEMVLIFMLFVFVILIALFSYDMIKISNLSMFNPGFLFLPYGVILFALMGVPAIPELQEELGKEKKKLKKVIIYGSLIPIVLYVLFSFLVVGIVGFQNFEILSPNERIATIAISFFSTSILGIFANIIAVLAMFTSFLTLGMALVEIYEYDYKIKRSWALILTFILPLIILFFKITTFIAVLGFTGAIAGGLEGILVILTYWKAKLLGERKPEFVLPKFYVLGSLIILLFVIGIISQFL